jgi:hypothetical protein
MTKSAASAIGSQLNTRQEPEWSSPALLFIGKISQKSEIKN